jgi:hypothetical protein
LALRVEQREIARRAVAELLLSEVEAFARRGFGLRLCFEHYGVGFQRPQHVGHFPERLQDRLPILRRSLVEGGDGGAPLRSEGAAVEDGLQKPRRDAPYGRAGPEQVADLRRLRAVPPGQRDLRVEVCRGHTDRGARRVQQLLRGADVGALANKRRRQAHGQISRQLQPFEVELGKIRRIPREPAGQDRQQVAGLGEPFLQRRHEHPGLGHLGPLCEHRDVRRPSELELTLDERELLLLRRKDLPRRLQLAAQGCFLDRRGDDIGGEGEVGALELIPLVVDLRLERLQLPPLPAEQVESVRHVHRSVVEGEGAGLRARLAERGGRNLLPCGGHAPVDGGEERPVIGPPAFLRLPERRLGRAQCRAVRQRNADPSIQRLGAEQFPPSGGNFTPRVDVLRGSADPRRGGRLHRQRLRGISRNLRGGRSAEIGADRATCERRGDEHGKQAQDVFPLFVSAHRFKMQIPENLFQRRPHRRGINNNRKRSRAVEPWIPDVIQWEV